MERKASNGDTLYRWRIVLGAVSVYQTWATDRQSAVLTLRQNGIRGAVQSIERVRHP